MQAPTHASQPDPKIVELQTQIARLVEEIGTSRFKGKEEDQLETCLIELMKLSEPKEGLKLTSELLKKCLAIINRYFSEDNIVTFLTTPHKTNFWNFPLYYFMRRCLRAEPDAFTHESLDKIRKLVRRRPYAQFPFPTLLGLQQTINTTIFLFDAQKLFEAYLQSSVSHGVGVAQYLLQNYGHEIDVNSVSSGSSLLSRLVNACVAASHREYPDKHAVETQVAAIDVLLGCSELVMTSEDIEAAKGMNVGFNIHPTLYGRVHAAFLANNFRKLRAILSKEAPEEEARCVNNYIVNLGDDIRQLEQREKEQVYDCEFLTDETRKQLIGDYRFGYLFAVHAVETARDLSEMRFRLEALFALGVYPWEVSPDGVTTLVDYAKSKGLLDLAGWLEKKWDAILAQNAGTQPAFEKSFSDVPVAAAANFASPAHPSASVSASGNSNNADVITTERKLSQ